IHVIARLLFKGGSGGPQARLDRAGAQDPDLSRHGSSGDRTQQQTRRDLHLPSPRNHGKLPQAYSARAPESLTTFAHFGISRAMYSANSRGVPVTASARSRPALIYGIADADVANMSWACPAITSVSAGCAPL